MQIMIDIPEEIYNYIHNEHIAMRVRDSHKVANAIANGVLLSEDGPQTIKMIPLDKIKKFREEVDNKYDWTASIFDERADGKNEMIIEILEMLSKLIESEDK